VCCCARRVGNRKVCFNTTSFFSSLKCIYGAGKFDKRAQKKPYAALVNCIADVCRQLNQRGEYKEILTRELKREELDTLIDVIPDIGDVVGCSSSKQADTARSKEGLEKLKYTLRLFLRAISLPTCPVVMCLDDLHWMDAASLDILQSILNDHELTNFVFVGSYRDAEAEDELLQWTADLPSSTRMTIDDLNEDDIQDLLQDLLKVQQVEDLAHLVHAKTRGNIFHVLQLMDYMQSEELLEYSLTKFRWTWDIQKLRAETSLSDNVVDIVSSRLNRLSPHVLSCLKLCSCLSFRFDPSILLVVKDAMVDENVVNVKDCLEKSIEEGILERLNENRLKFTHDRIHQAALRLIPNEEERRKVHLSMGRILWKEYGLDEPGTLETLNDKKLFVCTDQLNMGQALVQNDTTFRATWRDSIARRPSERRPFLPLFHHLNTYRTGLSF